MSFSNRRFSSKLLAPASRCSRKRSPRHMGTQPHLERLDDRIVPSASIQTNRLDYFPGDVAAITGSGFQANEVVDLDVINLSNGGTLAGSPGSWTVVADTNGNLQTSWLCTSDLLGTKLELDAKGETSGLTAS
jgi:hypothetical protein